MDSKEYNMKIYRDVLFQKVERKGETRYFLKCLYKKVKAVVPSGAGLAQQKMSQQLHGFRDARSF